MPAVRRQNALKMMAVIWYAGAGAARMLKSARRFYGITAKHLAGAGNVGKMLAIRQNASMAGVGPVMTLSRKNSEFVMAI